MRKLVLIDGHAILYRAYHAFPKTLRTRRGELVNAVYGFTRMLLKVVEDLSPACLAVAFDLPGPTFRHHAFVGYQAQRPKADEEMINQIERVFEVVKTLNIPIFTADGFEADDVMGTLAKQAVPKKIKSQKSNLKTKMKKSKLEVIIVTGDKDIMQLVRRGVSVYSPVKGFSQAKLYRSKEVIDLLGVRPDQIIDYKALVGDPSDNYPGVPGVGPKTAEELLGKYDDLETIYKNLEKIRPVVAKRLAEGKDSAYLSQELAKIVTNAPVKLSLKACRVHDYDHQKVKELFEKLEFKSLINKLPRVEKGKYQIEDKKEKSVENQMKLL
ncbi:5'-3' exonuclease H3TH domain-containing protein [Patescibacteria group bacterium]